MLPDRNKIEAELSGPNFEDVYTRAVARRLLSQLTGRLDETRLLSYDEVRRKIRCHDESYTGMQSVPVGAIIGSVGRYNDFDNEFLPLRRQSKERWRRINTAYHTDTPLPAVQLYKMGDAYFVKDGNHRVSVAKKRGIAYLDAEVIETRCRVPLPSNADADDLEEAEARALFLEWSQLDRLRPDQTIRATLRGGYHDLEEHINVHRYVLSQERKADVPLWEAIASWYDNEYAPLVAQIRADRILDRFPGRTETDLYLWVMDHLGELHQRYGSSIDPEKAVDEFAQRRAGTSVLTRLRRRLAHLFGR